MRETSLSKNLPELIVFAVFLCIQLYHINADFWNDEIYTLQNFIITSIGQTLTDYHVPNNHIFFSFISNLYLKIIHVEDLHVLFDTPWKMRALPLIFSFVSVYFTYKIGRDFYGRAIGLLAVVLLMSSFPFYNFSLQIRGYGLSIMFSVVLVYNLLSYLNKSALKNLLFTALSAACLFYTLPSNLYFLLSVLIILGLKAVVGKRQGESLLGNAYSYLGYAILLGMCIALLCYLPVIEDVFFNEYVVRGALLDLSSLKFNVLHLGQGLVYKRWFIVLLSIIGFLLSFRSLPKWDTGLLLCLSAILAPLFFLWINGQNAPPRILVFVLPFVSLLMAVFIVYGFKRWILNDGEIVWAPLTAVFLLALATLGYQLWDQDKRMLSDILKVDGRSQGMYYQYYSARYWPLKDMRSFSRVYETEPLPVILLGCEGWGIPNYFKKFDISYLESTALDSLLLHSDDFYVITNHPFLLDDQAAFEVEILNEELSYHNQLKVSRKE